MRASSLSAQNFSFKWWVAATIMLGMLTSTLSITTVNLAVPKMMASLRADLDTIQWVVTGYMIVQTLLMPMVGWLTSLIGLIMLPNSLAFGTFSLLSGRLSDLIDTRWAMIFGFSTFALGYYWCASLDIWTTTGTIILLLLIRSISYGWTNSPNAYATMQGLPEGQVKMASGLYNLIRGISGTFGVALCATLLEKRRDIHVTLLTQEQDARAPDLQQTTTSLRWLFLEVGEVGDMVRTKTTAALRLFAMREATISAYHDLFLLGAALSLLTIVPVLFFRQNWEKNGKEKD